MRYNKRRTDEEWKNIAARGAEAVNQGMSQSEFCKRERVHKDTFRVALTKLGIAHPFGPRKSRGSYSKTKDSFVTFAPVTEGKLEVMNGDGKVKILVNRNDLDSLKLAIRAIREASA